MVAEDLECIANEVSWCDNAPGTVRIVCILSVCLEWKTWL
jgi:hypothetical protein